jgi:Helix-turn-helix domain
MSEQKLCYSIDEFAKLQGVSRAQMYSLISAGDGPTTYCVGNRRRISIEAGARWIQEREKLAPPVQPVERLERGKRHAAGVA